MQDYNAYSVWICTKAVQQELVLVPEEEWKYHHAQFVGSLCQLCRLCSVVEVVVGHQQCLIRTDCCSIAADVG